MPHCKNRNPGVTGANLQPATVDSRSSAATLVIGGHCGYGMAYRSDNSDIFSRRSLKPTFGFWRISDSPRFWIAFVALYQRVLTTVCSNLQYKSTDGMHTEMGVSDELAWDLWQFEQSQDWGRTQYCSQNVEKIFVFLTSIEFDILLKKTFNGFVIAAKYLENLR